MRMPLALFTCKRTHNGSPALPAFDADVVRIRFFMGVDYKNIAI